MRIVVVGAGRVGFSLCRRLVQENHDVSLIETNEERARHVSNRLDCRVINDEGNNIRVLEEADINRADALVCVTNSDELNMIICGLAAPRYPRLVKIARVRNSEYARFRRDEHQTKPAKSAVPAESKPAAAGKSAVLGIDHFIYPDVEVARWVLNAVDRGAVGDVLAFPETPYELGSVDIAPGSPLDGLSLTDYRKVHPGESLVTLVERGGGSFLPSGASVLAAGDRIHIFTRGEEMEALFKLASGSGPALRRIGIVGGSQIGILIADGLLHPEKQEENLAEPFNIPVKGKGIIPLLKTLRPKNQRRVIIIEQDYELSKELSARFPEALVLNEDISDESFVAEERINNLDLIITATNHQELNIITAVYLKSRGVGRAIALAAGTGYGIIARQLGVNVVVPTEQVVVDSILSRLAGNAVRGVHRIGDGSTGIYEIEVAPEAPVAEKPITEFKISSGGLVMLANRGGDSFIPCGDYVFKVQDRVIIIAKHGSEKEIEKFFAVNL
ncbi:MAG: NAD-binding protein [Treponema sp.]|jgi:trk system potassium uptake protein TrkA|nr:NAD-binding protein [Treponema sp.]